MNRNFKSFTSITRLALLLLCVSASYMNAFSQVCTPQLVKQWGTVGQFNGLTDIAVDAAGNVYALDRLNHRVQKFDAEGNYLLQWGSLGSNNGQFYYPSSIEIDKSNNVYVVDRDNYRIQKFTSDGVFLTKWGNRGTGNGQFEYAWGMTIDPIGNIYVLDRHNQRVQKFDTNGKYLTQWNNPNTYMEAIDTDQQGNLYIICYVITNLCSDCFINEVQKFDANGNFILKWGSMGSGRGQFESPNGIAIDKSNNVYVTDANRRVQQFDTIGNYLTEWSNSDTGYRPRGIAVNAVGSVYITEDANNFNPDCHVKKFSCHPATEFKHLFFFDNGSETWASGYINPNDLHLLRYFDGSQRFGSGYNNIPTKVVPLEGDDPLKPEDLLICRGANCEEGAIINVQPGGKVIEQARWSPDLPHPVGTLLNGSWSHIVSTGRNKLLLYNNLSYQAKLIYLKGITHTNFDAAQVVKNFTIESSPAGSSFSGIINTPKGLLFYGGGIINNRIVLDRLLTFKETYLLCDGIPCRLTVTDSSSYFVGLRSPGTLVRVRNNTILTTPNPAGDLLLSYDMASGNAKFYTINTSGIPYFQQVNTQSIGTGWTQIAGIKDEILFYNQNDYSYALGNVKPLGLSARPTLTLTRQVAGSLGILAGWSHLVPVLPKQ